MNNAPAKEFAQGIDEVIRELGLGRKIRQYDALNIWKQIVGEAIASVTEAERIAGGKLFVRVARPTWRNELVYLKQELIGKINAALGEEVVRDIVFK